MAQGCVVVLDPSYEPHFGSAAVYWGSESPSRLVRVLVEDDTAFRAQQQRGHDFVAGELSSAAFTRTIGALIDAPDNESETT